MKRLENLAKWDFPDKKYIPDGYDLTDVPDATPENMVVLMDAINGLVDRINSLTPNLEESDD